jgi:hypothetical protein
MSQPPASTPEAIGFSGYRGGLKIEKWKMENGKWKMKGRPSKIHMRT